jgi:flagellar basal body-associated protein FliL
MNLVDRAKNIVLAPAAEWHVIEPEVTTVKELYLSYVLILAAISPVASFIGTTVFGIRAGFGLVIHTSLLAGLVGLVFSYVFALALVYVFSLVVDFLAPNFGGLKNPMQAFKFAAYSLTPAWLAGILNIVPLLGILAILAALYGIYVFFLGAPVMMKVPREKASAYTAVVIVIMIVISIVIGAVVGSITAALSYSGAGMLSSNSRSTDSELRATALAAQIAAASNQIQANANPSGSNNATTTTTVNTADAAAAGNAIAAMAAAVNNGAQIEPVDKDILKGMLPEAVDGLPRTSLEASRSGIATMQVALADGNYGDGQAKHMDLKVTDMGGAKMLGLAAAWALVDVDQSSDHGYEKTGKVNGRPTHEKFDKNGPSGEYAVLIGDRFLVEADGNVDMSVLKDGVAAIDAGKLEAMKNQGVH